MVATDRDITRESFIVARTMLIDEAVSFAVDNLIQEQTNPTKAKPFRIPKVPMSVEVCLFLHWQQAQKFSLQEAIDFWKLGMIASWSMYPMAIRLERGQS
jgi:hypothetical protein